MQYDVANITINKNNNVISYENIVECNMVRFGLMTFKLYLPSDKWFLKYQDYPLVRVVANSDLFMGIASLPYYIKIINQVGNSEIITKDNITDFQIAVALK